MAFRNRLVCYICDRAFRPGQMARIDGDENVNKRAIAIERRNAFERPPLVINIRTRLCVNCNQSVVDEIAEIEQDPFCLRLNVITQTRNNTCVICDAVFPLHRLSLECRINIFVHRDIFVPKDVRACQHHLDERGYFFQHLLDGLRFVNRPYRVSGQEMQRFLGGLRNAALDQTKFENIHSFSEEDFKIISPVTKEQFEVLYGHCRPVPREFGNRYVSKKDLLTFLCKLRQGLADDLLKVMFNYPSRQSTSLVIATVRKSLMQQFVPQNIGFDALTPNEFIQRHVTAFSNELYNPEPQTPKVIVCVDGTYAYVEKSSNFRVLKQTYSVHKGRHLVKPALIVGTDGYILNIVGPYFADSGNNDALMLINDFNNDPERMREWFPENSIMVVDRGYRDATEFLTGLRINWKMPACLQPGQRQLTTEQANESRLITKCRWIVEARNGHLKSIFKFLDKTITFAHLHNLSDFYLICGAIINRFYPLIYMNNANIEMARRMLEKSKDSNIVQALVEVEELHRRNARRWVLLNSQRVPDFPRLTLEYLRNITLGEYQLGLAPSYIQEKLQRDEDEIFQLEVPRNENQMPGLIRIRIYSRYRRAQRYQLWIAYHSLRILVNGGANEEEENEDHDTPIYGYYCTCKSGARTLGACAHVTSALWYLGWARHQRNVKYPPTSLLRSILDAAHRPLPVNPNNL